MGISFWLALERSRGTRLGRRRTLVALAVFGLALLLPAAALANHLFSDVPTNHTFHTNISNLANAGVTAGCGGGKYCPEDPVTRGQMAGFLNRGLGRVAEADISLSNITESGGTEIGSVTITPGTPPGALPGAKQFIRALFTGTIEIIDPNASACYCKAYISLRKGGAGLQALDVPVTVSPGTVQSPISIGGVIAATGSDPVTITLVAYIYPTPGPNTSFSVSGNLTAETIPFGSTGTSAP